MTIVRVAVVDDEVTISKFKATCLALLAKVKRTGRPILVTRRGRLAGIFFPRPEVTLPLELKRELYAMLNRTAR